MMPTEYPQSPDEVPPIDSPNEEPNNEPAEVPPEQSPAETPMNEPPEVPSERKGR